VTNQDVPVLTDAELVEWIVLNMRMSYITLYQVCSLYGEVNMSVQLAVMAEIAKDEQILGWLRVQKREFVQRGFDIQPIVTVLNDYASYSRMTIVKRHKRK
jgi:hypothetical protein